MKNAIKTCCEELKNNYTEGQAGGIGIYYYDPVDGEYIEDPRFVFPLRFGFFLVPWLYP